MGAADALRDDGRVSPELGQPGPEQTAHIAFLPPEILSEIISIVAREGVKKKDAENLLRSCRAIYCAGLPLLFREVTLDSKTGVEKLRALAGGPTGIDCTSFVRVLKIPAGMTWTKGNLNVLAKCLLHARRVSFEAGGPKILSTVWAVLKDAPMLETLALTLRGDVSGAFNDQSVFPTSVRVLHLYMRDRPKGDDLINMLDTRAPHLEEIRLDGGHIYAEEFNEYYKPQTYPVMASKVWGFIVFANELALVPKTAVDLLVYPANWDPAVDFAYPWHKLDSLTGLEVYFLSTTDLLRLPDLFPKLEKLVLNSPKLNLLPEQFVRAAEAVCKPGVEVTMNMRRIFSVNQAEEHAFWNAQPGVNCVVYGN